LEPPYPSAAACLADDLPAACSHLRYFPRLHKRFRSSNLLGRSLEEVRRKTKVIGRFPGENSCLSVCWAVLDLFLAGARGLELSNLRTLRAASASVALPVALLRSCSDPHLLYELAEIAVRLPVTGVRRRPKRLYECDRFACSSSDETPVRFQPFCTLWHPIRCKNAHHVTSLDVERMLTTKARRI
jgi:hypothetical protein